MGPMVLVIGRRGEPVGHANGPPCRHRPPKRRCQALESRILLEAAPINWERPYLAPQRANTRRTALTAISRGAEIPKSSQ